MNFIFVKNRFVFRGINKVDVLGIVVFGKRSFIFWIDGIYYYLSRILEKWVGRVFFSFFNFRF